LLVRSWKDAEGYGYVTSVPRGLLPTRPQFHI
jgi:hypothetical protein